MYDEVPLYARVLLVKVLSDRADVLCYLRKFLLDFVARARQNLAVDSQARNMQTMSLQTLSFASALLRA